MAERDEKYKMMQRTAPACGSTPAPAARRRRLPPPPPAAAKCLASIAAESRLCCLGLALPSIPAGGWQAGCDRQQQLKQGRSGGARTASRAQMRLGECVERCARAGVWAGATKERRGTPTAPGGTGERLLQGGHNSAHFGKSHGKSQKGASKPTSWIGANIGYFVNWRRAVQARVSACAVAVASGSASATKCVSEGTVRCSFQSTARFLLDRIAKFHDKNR